MPNCLRYFVSTALSRDLWADERGPTMVLVPLALFFVAAITTVALSTAIGKKYIHFFILCTIALLPMAHKKGR